MFRITVFLFFFLFFYILVQGGHADDMSVGWPVSWTRTIRGSSSPSTVLGMCFYFPSLVPEAALKMQTWDSDVVLKPSEWQRWLNPVKASICAFKIWQGDTEISLSWGAQDNLTGKFPCLLKLPPSHLEWPLSSVSPCPVCTGASLQASNSKFGDMSKEREMRKISRNPRLE